MSTVGSLAVNVVGDTSGLNRAMRAGRTELSLFSKGVGELKGVLVGFGASLAAAFTINALRSAADEMDKLAKDATRLGIATDKLQGLERFGQVSGASAEAVVAGLSKMEVAISKNADGFDKLKLSAEELKAMKPEEAFYKIADAIKAMPNADDRMAAVKDIFGKGGAALLPTIMQGGAAIEGGVGQYGHATEDQVKQVEAANDAMTELGFAFTDLKNILVVDLAPAVTDVVKTITSILGGKPDANGVSAGGLVGTPGITRGAYSDSYDTALGKMSDDEFKKFQHTYGKLKADQDAGKGFYKDENGNWAGNALTDFTTQSTGLSSNMIDSTTFTTAMSQRMDKVMAHLDEKRKAEDPEAAFDRAYEAMKKQKEFASLGTGIDPNSVPHLLELSKRDEELRNAATTPAAEPEKKLVHGSGIVGYGAIEGGSVEAFRQERRSTLAASANGIPKQQLDAQKKAVEENKKQNTALAKIDANTKKAQQIEIVDITA